MSKPVQSGRLEGRFLVSMPGMDDSIFADSVVFVCAHSDEGAMGFVVNKRSDMVLDDLLEKVHRENATARRLHNASTLRTPVHIGGPVDENRGFVLHSADFESPSTIPITSDIHLTSTLSLLDAIAKGRGPRRSLVSLGYAGWGAGQLEDEMKRNFWLTAEADPQMIFSGNSDAIYAKVLKTIGISPLNFVSEIGHA